MGLTLVCVSVAFSGTARLGESMESAWRDDPKATASIRVGPRKDFRVETAESPTYPDRVPLDPYAGGTSQDQDVVASTPVGASFETPDVPLLPIEAPPPTTEDGGPKRLRVRMPNGRTVVARVHGCDGPDVHVMLPDGRLGIPDAVVPTGEPFRVATREEIVQDLIAGPFADFRVKHSAHYLVAYRSTGEFADASARVLENLYEALTEAFRRRGVPTSEAEFPLVAVVFRTEREFRAYKPVAPDVQAYYEVYTNRIYFYEAADRDDQSPEVAAVRRPQTVAHEGTHQVLQNIGVHPRLASWPAWLVEGLAEYCATPVTTKKGTDWNGLGRNNAFHLATLRDLEHPLFGQVAGATRPEHIGRPRGMPLVEYLVTKDRLSPTDYALAWGMTHYLAKTQVRKFLGYLRRMSALPPLKKLTPDEHLAAFRDAFGNHLGRVDREIDAHLSRLKAYQALPYYAILFEQRLKDGVVKRAIVSQSPSMIRQWLETVTSDRGDPPLWEPLPHATRTPALLVAERWIHEPEDGPSPEDDR